MTVYAHHLSIKTHFSLGESLLDPETAVKQAKAVGYESVALMDTMTISAAIDFSKFAQKEGLKPIIGCQLRIMDDDPTLKGKEYKGMTYWMPKVYVLNEQGLQDLMSLLSLAYQEDHFYYTARLGLDELLATLERGNLAISTGDLHSLFYRPPVDRDYIDILQKITRATRGRGVFVEVSPIDTPLFDTLNKKAHGAATILGLPMLLTYPARTTGPGDVASLNVLTAITRNTKMSDPWTLQQTIDDLYIQQPGEIVMKLGQFVRRKKASTQRLREAPLNMQVLVDMVEYEFKPMSVTLPKMAADEFAQLVANVKKGWVERLGKSVFGYKPDMAELRQTYKDRLAYELGVLRKMKFESYFLLVQEIVIWSKGAGIRVGPGRGSVGGSLVAYLLGITDVDPIRFGLIFERFINPERIDLPDADLDFMSTRRQEVIEYLVRRFGRDRVAGVSNFTTMASGSAIRDSGRVLGLSQDQLNPTKLVPKEHGQPVSLTAAAERVPELEKFSGEHATVWRHALKLEGKMRSLGKHAAGVVIAGEPLIKRAVIESRSGEPTVNWDKTMVESMGLVKVDVLGLSTLDVLGHACAYIEERHGKRVDLTRLNLDDSKVLEAFGRGETTGVFQFEGFGMRKLLKDLALGGSLTFDDLSAATSLFRPGPLDSGLLDDYVARKQGASMVIYDHANMEAALKDTFGVMVYQEQVMQVARDLSGFTLTEADHLRKAIGKKDAKKMAEMRDKFVDGALSHSGMAKASADYLFTQIEQFASYSFNKSHAVEYSLISYQCMWLKQYYPAEFYAACLSILDEDKLPGLVKDAMLHNIVVLPPDINHSSQRFEIGFDTKREKTVLYTPFNRIKGLSENTSNYILAARNSGPFAGFADFFARVNKSKVNKRHQEALTLVGAFASVEPTQLDPLHPDRLKDQITLMPGLVVEIVKADRVIKLDKFEQGKLIEIINDTKSCEKCSLKGAAHPTPRLGRKPRFMVIFDAPHKGEEKKGKFMEGDGSKYLKAALTEAGLGIGDAYFTSVVKACKTEKQLTNEQINGCSSYLDREIELLKPPVILALGSTAIRHLVPDAKGNWQELAGKSVFSTKLDATIIMGFNPMMIFHDPDRQDQLNDIVRKVADAVS